MARTWLIDSRGIARKVKNPTQFSASQIKENGANRECPNCHHRIDNSDVSIEWPGLPAGVKFDPSDVELLEHLAGKAGLGNSESHLFIDEFILTLEGDEGICYTHPENLPGSTVQGYLLGIDHPRKTLLPGGNDSELVLLRLEASQDGTKKDGSSVHFFHRTANAYATGHRKRRKIQNQCSLTEEHVRWHKTGKTKAIIENGVHKGWKKIMVLYKSSKKGYKPEKLNWVMFQYHLGMKENEKKGEYVVSKIFYQQQQKQNDKNDVNLTREERDKVIVEANPKTPKTNTPNLHRPKKRPLSDEDDEENESEFFQEVPRSPLPAIRLDDDKVDASWLADESQPVIEPDPNVVDDSLLCNEILDSYASYFLDFNGSQMDAVEGDVSSTNGIPDLDGIDLGTPPDFQLADLQFGSQESIMGWLDRL